MNIQDLLGAVVQSGMSQSSTTRIKSSLGGGGLLDSLSGMLGGAAGAGTQGGGALGGLGGLLGGAGGAQSSGGMGGLLGSILSEAGRAVGGNNNLALGGLGALAGAILGGGKKGAGGALGGGVMALLGAMAFQALKASSAGKTPKVPLGLVAPKTKAEEAELERNSELVLKAMINAAKSDGKIDQGEIQRIVGKVQESGVDKEAQAFLMAEMKKPMETDSLIKAVQGKPELAAQIYGASLLAIEVDTPAEQEYLSKLAAGMGLKPGVTQSIQQVVGLPV